jgi:formylglycine-generating enzyme required for sulfatase activity
MMRTEVTQALWERLAGKSVGLLSVTERISDRDYIGADLPMVNISWLDSVLFANASTDLCNGAGSSLRKAYRFIRDERGEVVKVEQVPGADGWRLPTEDEWEVAARLSSGQYRTPFAGGMDSMEELITGANTAQEDEWPNLAPADSGNQGGFCHLTGNVKEWCWDRYDRSRGGRGETQADLQQKHSRVARGGSAHLHPAVAGVSVRSSIPVSARGSALGVRLVRSVS